MCRVKDTATDLYNALFETTGIDEALTDYGLLVVVKYWPGRVTRIYSARIVKRSPELMDHAQDKAGEWVWPYSRSNSVTAGPPTRLPV